MQRVLITGAAGFVGRHCLAPLLARGFAVHGVSSSGREVPVGDVVWHKADLLKPEQVESLMARVQPTHLLHLAWIADPKTYRDAAENVAWVEASLRLARSFYDRGGHRALLVGSCFEYDWSDGRCHEVTTPLAPTTLYGTCKAALYSVFERYVAEFQLDGAWARPFFLYGPHAPAGKMPGAVIAAVEKGETIKCSHGNQLRDFMYVLDAADALAALLDSGVQGAVNVATGQALRVKDLILAVTDYCGGLELVQLGARPTDDNEPPLLVADTTRLNRELGWTPKFGYREALAATIQSWRESEFQLVR